MIKVLFARLMQRLQLRESWVIFFIMGIIMMTFPFMGIFNKPVTIFGFPLLFIYLTLGWAFSTFVIFIFMIAYHYKNPDHKEKDES